MIHTINSSNMAGMTVSGDYLDFEQLYEAIHSILPNEEEAITVETVRLRVLGFCYDLRHAMMGHREFSYVDNGLDPNTMKGMGVVGSQKNLYFSFHTFYPEMLFIVGALKYFIEEIRVSPNHRSIQTVENFRASVIECLENTLSSQKLLNTLRSINAFSRNPSNYMTQYIDVLNLRFLDWDKEKREGNISIIAKRIAERGKEYQRMKEEIFAAAAEHGCLPSQISLSEEYPEFIDW